MISIQKLAGLIVLVMLAAIVIAVVPAAVLQAAGWRQRLLQELIPSWWIHEAVLQMEIAVRSFQQY